MRGGPKKAQLKAMRRRPDRDETPGYRSGLELELMRPSPPRGRSTCGYTAQLTRKQEHRTRILSGSPHPTRQSFGTTRRIRTHTLKMQVRKPLGLNP
jgi:hypothetical protein